MIVLIDSTGARRTLSELDFSALSKADAAILAMKAIAFVREVVPPPIHMPEANYVVSESGVIDQVSAVERENWRSRPPACESLRADLAFDDLLADLRWGGDHSRLVSDEGRELLRKLLAECVAAIQGRGDVQTFVQKVLGGWAEGTGEA